MKILKLVASLALVAGAVTASATPAAAAERIVYWHMTDELIAPDGAAMQCWNNNASADAIVACWEKLPHTKTVVGG